MSAAGNDHRKPKWYQIVLQGLLPALILAIVTWMASTMSQTKLDLGVYRAETNEKFNTIKISIDGIRSDLAEHNEASIKLSARNALDHHRAAMTPCNRCHIK